MFGSILGTIVSTLVEPILITLIGVIAAQVVRILNTQAKKVGLELTEAQQQRLKAIVADALKRVEELARRQHLTGDQKRVAATDAILSAASAELGKEFSREQVGRMIDAVLPDVRVALNQPAVPGTARAGGSA